MGNKGGKYLVHFNDCLVWSGKWGEGGTSGQTGGVVDEQYKVRFGCRFALDAVTGVIEVIPNA